ncbi:uncharacterized protein LOC662774 [Tribolium castaneum]|uniref:Uncharacterized protein n=1 Tax=Tribolium castaneum TaxID=7070 RepID=D6WSS7_TRICA|nr:PREDICTED: transmembrane protein 179 [Tribolium castaneum]EFA06654.1 hypothetical protein TcasGA2_TC009579 [Tribolium castaneum]|eukprot:XP_973944.1 PREDICTED: transmembrane protein 179 [Tribolium castaneum]
MVVVDQFYQIVEGQTSTVSSFWKVGHIVLCITCAMCGLLTAFTFGRVLDNFGYNCVLKSHLVFDTSNQTTKIDLTMTTWGPPSECNFVQFTPLVLMISAVVWGTFFSILARGGAGLATDLLARPWRIVYPCLIFTTIVFIAYVISTCRLTDGMRDFCNQFPVVLNNSGCVPEISAFSRQFQDESTENVLFFNSYTNMSVAILSADVGTWLWVCQLILCVLRVFCVADFELQLVTIETKDEELIEKVVELNEDEVSEV